MTLRPYQQEASDWLANNRRGIVEASAGAGKTILMAAALDKAIRSRARSEAVRIGWIANTLEQCQQAWKAIEAFPMVKKQDVRVACAAAQADWSDRQVLVVDECHTALAETHVTQILTCNGARWGMTATLPEDAERCRALRELIGPAYIIPRSAVQSCLAPAEVTWLDATDYNLREPIDEEIDRLVLQRGRWWKGDPGALWGNVAFQVCIERGIIGNQARNEAAIEFASTTKQTLVLVNQVEHGQWLASQIPNARACYAKMGAKPRREVLEDFKQGIVRCIVATSLADEGLDLPNAEVLVMVSAGRNRARAEQRTGRVLRAYAGKVAGRIYDFKDLYHPLPAKHARLRWALYSELGYKQHNRP